MLVEMHYTARIGKRTTARENDKKYDTPNVAALKNEIKVLKATVSTYYDELKRLQHETNKKNIDHRCR